MADHSITTVFIAPIYSHNGNLTSVHHAKHGETISWMSASGAISVTLPSALTTDQNTSTFTAAQNQPTQAVKLIGQPHDQPGTSYKYTVTVNGLTDDPQIIFDDAGARAPGREREE